MSVTEISEVQATYILDNFPDAAIYPPGGTGARSRTRSSSSTAAVHLLTRDQDLESVLSLLNPPRLTVAADEARAPQPVEVTHPIPGLARVELVSDGQDDPVADARILFGALDAIEQQLGPGIAGPDHMMSVTPATAARPRSRLVPGDAAPQPGISRSGCDGRGTLVAVVDTGLVEMRRPCIPG